MSRTVRVVAACMLIALVAGVASPAVSAEVKPLKVVILVGGHGYDKANFSKAWGGHDDIQCEVWKGKPYTVFDDIKNFKYDAILMFNLSSGITDTQKANFQTLLKKGTGLVVWHHAMANCQNWPEFEKIAGCKYWLKAGEKEGKKIGRSGYAHDRYKMHIEDTAHPITKGLKDFEIDDESYNKQTFAKGIHVLVSTQHPKSDKPIAWTVNYKGARVFGYQAGHDAKAWTNPAHRQLLSNGIRWTAGRLGADGPKSVKAEVQTARWAVKWWQKRHEEKLAAKKAMNNKVDLLWVGDSITHAWDDRRKAGPVWDKYYAKRNALNIGFSGDRTEHVLWRLRNGAVDGISPKLAIVMIGTNNAGHRQEASKDTALGVKAILAEMRTRMPKTKILLLAIFPRGKDDNDALRKLNMGTNAIIKGYADDKAVFFLSINDTFLEKDRTLPKTVMPDLLHPNAKGYQIWAEAIEPKVKELMGE